MHIIVDTEWTLDDFVECRILSYKHTCGSFLRLLAHISAGIMFFVLIFSLIQGHFVMTSIAVYALVCYAIYIRNPITLSLFSGKGEHSRKAKCNVLRFGV